MALSDVLNRQLTAWTEAGLRRQLRPLQGIGSVVHDGVRELLNFSSNDYLDLAGDARLTNNAESGATASRLVTGHLVSHDTLETRLEEFLGLPALVFSSGFAASLGTIPALVGKGDAIFSDALNHASLIDGARLSRAPVHVFRHADPGHLDELLQAHRGTGNALVLSDGLFSMDGDLAPLADLQAVCARHDAWLYLDEAHSLGLLGPEGRGLSAVTRPDVLLGTLGKSFGAGGAFVAGTSPLKDWLIQKARSFVFSTGLPPTVATAATKGVALSQAEPWRRERALTNAAFLRAELQSLGFHVPSGSGPIIPVLFGANEKALQAAKALEAQGILVVAIRPPTVPEGSARLRIAMTAGHTQEHLNALVSAFRRL
ncbi:MAG: 8-amino-7-oxononanoate synthase [Myxococcota bacterium]